MDDVILQIIDQHVVLKKLLNEDNFTYTQETAESFGISDWPTYKESFKKRNVFGLEELTKSIKSFPADENNGDLEEINEEEVKKYFSMIQIKKALSDDISRGIVYALSQAISSLNGYSSYLLSYFSGNLDDPKLVKKINDFQSTVKNLRDSLRFISFDGSGKISSAPVYKSLKEKVKKYYETYVSSWDVWEVNQIDSFLEITIPLIKVLIEIFPDNEDFSDYVQMLSDSLMIIEEFKSGWADMVLKANSLNLVYTSPKEVTPKSEDTIPFYEKINKAVAKSEFLIKSVDDFQGIITGIVLEPGDEENRDLQDQWISAEEIEKAMHYYMENHQKLGLQHESILKAKKKAKKDAVLIENYITPQDIEINSEPVKKGSWVMTWKLLNEDLKKMVKDGEKDGFSVGGIADIIPG